MTIATPLSDKLWRKDYCIRSKRSKIGLPKLVKEIKGPLADLLDIHVKAEHHREFE